jgi:hypothetical protein
MALIERRSRPEPAGMPRPVLFFGPALTCPNRWRGRRTCPRTVSRLDATSALSQTPPHSSPQRQEQPLTPLDPRDRTPPA